jgi:hypothetical protein
MNYKYVKDIWDLQWMKSKGKYYALMEFVIYV